jgi:hypothetical protein
MNEAAVSADDHLPAGLVRPQAHDRRCVECDHAPHLLQDAFEHLFESSVELTTPSRRSACWRSGGAPVRRGQAGVVQRQRNLAMDDSMARSSSLK